MQFKRRSVERILHQVDFNNTANLSPGILARLLKPVPYHSPAKFYVMSTQKILAGALAGIAIGILIAPASGSETRKKISETAGNLKDRLRRLRGVANDELDELKNVIEQEVSGLKEDTRQKILRLIESSKKGVNHLKEEAMAN